MICTGQRSDASSVQQRRQSGTIPTARSPLNLYCSTICENESHGFWSKSSGQVFQQAPQLTQAMRSIITFIWLVPGVLVIHIIGWDHKGNEYCCSLAKAQSQAINISGERDFLFFCISAWRYAGTGMPGKLSNRDYCWIKSSVIFDLRCWCVYPVPICTKLINSCKLQFKFALGLIIWRNFKLPFVITTTIWYQWHGYGQMVMGMQYINARTVGEKCRRETAPARGNGSPLLTNLILPV
jgi:hypothetical protein